MADLQQLEDTLEKDDEQLLAELPEALEGVEDDLETLLVERPDTFEKLVQRVSELENADEFAREDPETVERYFTILWGCLELISEVAPSVREQIDTEFRVQWEPTDTDVRWYAQTDTEEGRIFGGPGEVDEPEVTFKGETNTLFSMMGDDDFNAQQAFMQGEYQIEGELPKAVQFGNTMETVQDNAEDLNV